MSQAPADASTGSSSAADPAAASQPKPGRQRTIANPASFDGVGFFTASDVSVRLLPAEPNTGLVFVRADLEGRPRIPALVAHRVQRHRRTSLQAGGASVEMTEHLLAALAGMGVDNCLIELDGPEVPGLDGSSLPIVEAIAAAGVAQQPVPRIPLVVQDSACARDGDALVAVHPGPTDHLEITFNLDYGEAPGIGSQSFHFEMTPESFAREIAPARTFVREVEIDALRAQGIGRRTTTRDLLVFGADGSPIDNSLRFRDECVRHKILDCIGDLALLGRPLYGHVLAHRSGHNANAALVKEILRQEEDRTIAGQLAGRPLLDAIQIEKILPHRYPFLLVDRVVELDPNRRAVGIKNVSCNEPFFQGHWPGRPVMPGVLIVEAMAQLAGIMLTQWHGPGRHAFIVGMDDIRLRRQVVPGDQLRLEAVSLRLKSKTAVLQTKAWVDRDLAAEAQLRLVVLDQGSTPPEG